MRTIPAIAFALALAAAASSQVTVVPGTGCMPANRPTPNNGVANLGGTFIALSDQFPCTRPPSVAFVLLGFGSNPLPPLPLGCAPAPNNMCALGVNFPAFAVSASNSAQLSVTLPTNPAAVGLCFEVQGGCIPQASFQPPFCFASLQQMLQVCITP